MKHFAQPTPGLPNLAHAAALTIEQLHDRIQSELLHHTRKGLAGFNTPESNIELSQDEARLISGNLSKVVHLLRSISEGSI